MHLTFTDTSNDTVEVRIGSNGHHEIETADDLVYLVDDDLRRLRDAIDDHFGDRKAPRPELGKATLSIIPEIDLSAVLTDLAVQIQRAAVTLKEGS